MEGYLRQTYKNVSADERNLWIHLCKNDNVVINYKEKFPDHFKDKEEGLHEEIIEHIKDVRKMHKEKRTRFMRTLKDRVRYILKFKKLKS